MCECKEHYERKDRFDQTSDCIEAMCPPGQFGKAGDPRKSFAISLGGRESLIKGENCFQLHEQARCSDFRCEDFICLTGYLKKGSTCVDTNECEHASHQCSDNSICMDTEGRDSDGFEFNLSYIESYGLLDQSERSTGL